MSKKFTFRYQNLLQVKEKYEELAQQRFNEALKVLEKEKKQLKTYEIEKDKSYNILLNKTQNGIQIEQLRSYGNYLSKISKNIEIQKGMIDKCTCYVDEQRLTLMNAAKERKIFENLKEKAKEYYEYDEKKAEEKLIDQLVTFNNYKGI